MKKILLLLALSQLTGCFFVWIPGSVIDATADLVTGNRGKHCVTTMAHVGDWITVDHNVWVIKSLSGTSSRCTNPDFPIRAELEPPQN